MNEGEFRDAVYDYLQKRREDITFTELMPEDKFINYHVARLMSEGGHQWDAIRARTRIDELYRGLVNGMLWCNNCMMAVSEDGQQDMQCPKCGRELMASVPPFTSPLPQ